MTVLHKEVYGLGAPIVMLHGWAMHTGVWRNFAQALAYKQQVICLDLPGHGLSESVEPYTLESVVDAIARELPEQACDIVGWSLGGNVAIRLAEKYPQRIKSIVLIGSNPHFIKTESWQGVEPLILKAFANNMQENGVSTLLRFMSLQVQGTLAAKMSLKYIKAAMQECAIPEVKVLMGGLSILQTVDQIETLSHLSMPVLMIFGGRDQLVPVSVAEQCQALQDQIEVSVIAEAAHIPFITHQQQLLPLVQDFIQQSDT